MSDLFAALNRLEVEFSEAFEAHGDGGNLTFALFPMPEAVEVGHLQIERGTIPRDYLPGTTWADPFGVALWTDFTGEPHRIISFVAGTPHSAEPLQAFLRLAKRAGALCFRLPRGRAQTGPGNSPELNWLGTLYSYLKGTLFVTEGPGYSRLQSVFSASIEVLSLIHRGDSDGNAMPYTGSLRPGIPGVEGEAHFEFTVFGGAEEPAPEPLPNAPAAAQPNDNLPPPQPQPTTATSPVDQTGLKPDQFRFPCGQVVGEFTSKHLLLLRLLQPTGKAGIELEAVVRELGYTPNDKGRRALGQLVTRTQEKIDGRAPYLIELVNGFYCLTCTDTHA